MLSAEFSQGGSEELDLEKAKETEHLGDLCWGVETFAAGHLVFNLIIINEGGDVPVTHGGRVKGILPTGGGCILTAAIELREGVGERKEAVEGGEDEAATIGEGPGHALDDRFVLLIGLHQAEAALTEHDGRIELVLEGKRPGIGFDEGDDQVLARRLGSSAGELCFTQVDARDVIPSPGKLDGMPPGSTADIQNPDLLVKAQLSFDEITLTDGSLGEGFLIIVRRIV